MNRWERARKEKEIEDCLQKAWDIICELQDAGYEMEVLNEADAEHLPEFPTGIKATKQ